ncbi:MAG: pilus assembly protein [Micavibrio sp.]|nr:pilus assembly protein [Micavibrio sp.]
MGFITRYLYEKTATTAIEFGLLFIPYLMVILAIIELAIMYTSASLLEGATQSAARMIRTGQLQQSAADPQVQFRDKLCDYATVLIDCNKITVEVIPIVNFTSYEDFDPEYDEDGNLISQGFDVGSSNDKILVRASYRYRLMTPFIGEILSGNTGYRLFMSTIVLQTEPYEFEGEV